jgi:hypothetical protein
LDAADEKAVFGKIFDHKGQKMIFGLEPVTLSKLYVAAALTACPAMKSGDIRVDLNIVDSPYVTNVTSAQLTQQQMERNPDTSAFTDGKWMVGGVTVYRGPKIKYSAHFPTMTDPKTGNTCFTIGDAVMTITYDPLVYIAADYKHLGCRYSQTLAHEKRHVDIGRRTIEEFKPYFRKRLQQEVDRIGVRGPMPKAQAEAQRQSVLQQLDVSVKQLEQEFLAKFRARQATIDTEAAYLRDSAMCPGQFPQFDGKK